MERRHGRPLRRPIVPRTSALLAECITGDPRSDFSINKLFATIADQSGAHHHLLLPSELTFARAGALRTRATAARPAGTKQSVSAIDAMVVALAEERSRHTPVIVTTSDPADIQLLVDLTGTKNIGVWTV